METLSVDLQKLVTVPDEKRDQSWENLFFQKLTSGHLSVLSADPQTGPDGWPYLLTVVDDSAAEPVQKMLHWCATKGVGLVVNPNKDYPDYVFTYGMIWHFRQTGYFYLDQAEVKTGVVEVNVNDTNVMSGSPSEEFLPKYVRQILKEFFRDQGLLQVKILMLSQDGGKHFDLCFSLESLRSPPTKEHSDILEAISWFMPPHYSLMLMSEKGLPSFFEL